MVAVRILLLTILCVISVAHRRHGRSRESSEDKEDYYSLIASIIDKILSSDDECPITCPCFTADDILENCMDECSFTNSLPIQQEIICGSNTFKITPFNNQCIRNEQDPIQLTDAESTQCTTLIAMSEAVSNCAVNEVESCPVDTNFTTRQNVLETQFRDSSITNTININIDENDVEGLVLDDIIVSVAAAHTRIGNVLARLSHDGTSVELFGDDDSPPGCTHDNILVTITDKADLSSANLATCEDNAGADVNGNASLGFFEENAVIGLGGTRQPINPLSVFIDQDVSGINGDWNLILRDFLSANIGYFGAWEITFVYVNQEVRAICESAVEDRSECCNENQALCESIEEYCKSSACLIAGDANNLETIVNQLFTVVDLQCSEQ